MASIWEAPDDIRRTVEHVKAEHHPHLANASLWVMMSDSKGIVDNRLVPTTTRLCTKTERLSAGHDFKITISMEAWDKLTDAQRRIAIDEALCRCGVKCEPKTVVVNGKEEVIKDDLGRVIYSEEVAIDKEGRPRWRVLKPDAALYFPLLRRHQLYSEEAENVQRVLDGKDPILPIATTDGELVDQELEGVL